MEPMDRSYTTYY